METTRVPLPIICLLISMPVLMWMLWTWINAVIDGSRSAEIALELVELAIIGLVVVGLPLLGVALLFGWVR